MRKYKRYFNSFMSEPESTSDSLEDFIMDQVQHDPQDIARLAEIMNVPQVRNEVGLFRDSISQTNSNLTLLRNRYDALIQSDKISPEMREIAAILNILLDQPQLAHQIFQSIDAVNTKKEIDAQKIHRNTRIQLHQLRKQVPHITRPVTSTSVIKSATKNKPDVLPNSAPSRVSSVT